MEKSPIFKEISKIPVHFCLSFLNGLSKRAALGLKFNKNDSRSFIFQKFYSCISSLAQKIFFLKFLEKWFKGW